MKTNKEQNIDEQLGPGSILIHLGILVFGISAALTGLLADDYNKVEHLGFSMHSWIGMGLTFFISLRLITGLIGPRSVRFLSWMPFTPGRIRLVIEDIKGLLTMQMPDRPTHQGLAGLVQTFGLIVFLFMAGTGTCLYFFLEPGKKAYGLVDAVKEVHEAGIVLIPLFLSMHAGAVLLHALRGNHLWMKMFLLSDTIRAEPARDEAVPQER